MCVRVRALVEGVTSNGDWLTLAKKIRGSESASNPEERLFVALDMFNS
jgi:hypothetical protein